MDATKGLEDQEPGIFNEIFQTGNKEKVIEENGFTFPQLFLSTIKVEVHIQTLNKLGNGVFVCVALLLYNFDQVLESCPPLLFVGDDGCGQVTQDVGTCRLDCVQI